MIYMEFISLTFVCFWLGGVSRLAFRHVQIGGLNHFYG